MTFDEQEVLRRFHRALVREIQASNPEHLHGPFTVAEIYQNLVPYRTHRDELGVEMNADYEHALLRLLAGEGDYLTIESSTARQEIIEELESPNPNTALFREFAAADVRLNPSKLEEALAEVFGGERGEGGGGEGKAGEEAEMEEAEASTETAEGPVGPIGDQEEEAEADEALVVSDEGSGGGGLEEAAEGPQEEEDAGEAAEGDLDSGGGVLEFSAEDTGPPFESCPWCREKLPQRPNVNFCPYCGSNVRLIPCPACGEELELTWRFCVACGMEVTS